MSVADRLDFLGVLVRQLQGALDGKSKKSGVVTLTWPGANQQTNAPTVTHGLGKTPETVQLTVISTPVDAWTWANTVGSTTFLLSAKTSSAAPAAASTCVVAWEVTG